LITKNKRCLSLLFCGLILLVHSIAHAQNLTEKFSTTKTVFDNLVNAYGNAKAAPALAINPKTASQNFIAAYIPTPTPKICLDEKLYDLCMQTGNDSLNALAVILSHELAHYYNDHSWCSDFAFAVKDKIKIPKADKIVHEREADNFGLYHACIAGYKPFGMYDKLIDKVYLAYNLTNDNPNYPTKNERKLISKAAQQAMQLLYAKYLKGLKALKTEAFDTAIVCFNEVNQFFPSRENYNNLGVAKALKALHYKPLEKIEFDNKNFYYPIQLDSTSRLKTNNDRGGHEINEAEIQALLQAAKKDFEKALTLQPDYMQAYINLACVYDLIENPEAGIGAIKQMPAAYQNTKAANRILGICYYHVGNEKMFNNCFEKIK
jgi:hypothetical protein